MLIFVVVIENGYMLGISDFMKKKALSFGESYKKVT